jgi:hypothetical protein
MPIMVDAILCSIPLVNEIGFKYVSNRATWHWLHGRTVSEANEHLRLPVANDMSQSHAKVGDLDRLIQERG